MRCPVVDNSRSSPVLMQGLPCGAFCDKLEKNLQGSGWMSLREKLLRVAPEEWENEFVRIRPMTTRDDLIYAGDGCRLTDEQREFVNPVWFSLGRAYLAPEDHDPCLIETSAGSRSAFCASRHGPMPTAGAIFSTSGSRGGATESGRRSWRSACSGWPIRICRSSWPWRLPTHGRSGFTARWASGSCPERDGDDLIFCMEENPDG